MSATIEDNENWMKNLPLPFCAGCGKKTFLKKEPNGFSTTTGKPIYKYLAKCDTNKWWGYHSEFTLSKNVWQEIEQWDY